MIDHDDRRFFAGRGKIQTHRIVGARRLARRGDAKALAARIHGAPLHDAPGYAQFLAEVEALRRELAESGDFQPSAAVSSALERIRREIGFMSRDRAMDAEVARICAMVAAGALGSR